MSTTYRRIQSAVNLPPKTRTEIKNRAFGGLNNEIFVADDGSDFVKFDPNTDTFNPVKSETTATKDDLQNFDILGSAIGYFTFDDTSSLTRNEVGQHDASNITDVNSTTTTVAVGNGALAFNTANSSKFVLGTDAFVNAGNNFTLGFWFQWNSSGGSKSLFRTASTGPQLKIQLSSDDHVEALIADGNGKTATGTTALSTSGTWHYIAVTHDNKTLRVYVDGEYDEGEHTFTTDFTASNPMFYGPGPGDYIDEVGVWNRVLRDVEINSLFNNGNGSQTFLSRRWYLFPARQDVDFKNNRITGLGGPSSDNDALNRITADGRFLRIDGSNSMNANLTMGGANSITGIALKIGDNTAAITREYLEGGNVQAALNMNSKKITSLNDATTGTDALNRNTADGRFLLLDGTNSMGGNLSMDDSSAGAPYKVVGLASPSADGDAVRLKYLQDNYYTQSNSNNRFLQIDGTNGMNNNLDMNNDNNGPYKIVGLANPGTSDNDAVNLGYLQTNHYSKSTSDTRFLLTDGTNSMRGHLNMNDGSTSYRIKNLGDATNGTDALNRNTADGRFLRVDGTNSMNANMNMSGNNIININGTNESKFDVANKDYVQTYVSNNAGDSSDWATHPATEDVDMNGKVINDLRVQDRSQYNDRYSFNDQINYHKHTSSLDSIDWKDRSVRILWKPNGTELLVWWVVWPRSNNNGPEYDYVRSYKTAIAFDIRHLSTSMNKEVVFSNTQRPANLDTAWLSDDGIYMFLLTVDPNNYYRTFIERYTLSTPGDISSTSSSPDHSVLLSGTDNNYTREPMFTADGKRFISPQYGVINPLSTAWDERTIDTSQKTPSGEGWPSALGFTPTFFDNLNGVIFSKDGMLVFITYYSQSLSDGVLDIYKTIIPFRILPDTPRIKQVKLFDNPSEISVPFPGYRFQHFLEYDYLEQWDFSGLWNKRPRLHLAEQFLSRSPRSFYSNSDQLLEFKTFRYGKARRTFFVTFGTDTYFYTNEDETTFNSQTESASSGSGVTTLVPISYYTILVAISSTGDIVRVPRVEDNTYNEVVFDGSANNMASGGIFRSSDTDGDGTIMFVGNDNNDDPRIQRSTDHGTSWTDVTPSDSNLNSNIPPSPITGKTLRIIKYADGTWIAGGDGGLLLRSTDNGSSWEKLYHPSGTSPQLASITKTNRTWFATARINGGVKLIRSIADGRAWETISVNGSSDPELRNMYADGGLLLVHDEVGQLWETTDEGETFDLVYEANDKIENITDAFIAENNAGTRNIYKYRRRKQ
jgi:hypothetical protein